MNEGSDQFMAKYIIAHDLGTSGDKATLFSTQGEMLDTALYAYDAHFFNGNWAEQDPEDLWQAVKVTTRKLTSKIDKRDILAISFSGHMQGCLAVDREGRPLRPHILWADNRSTRQMEQIAEKIDFEEFYHITGHRLSAAYTLTKAMWIRDNEPEIYEKTYKFLQIKDYLVFRLTGRILTDYTDASGTMMFDLNKFEWSQRILDIAGLDPAKLPDAMPSTTVAGHVLAEAAEECGLSVETRVVIGAGDGMCATVGAGSVREGEAYACVGTSGWIASTTKKPIWDADCSLLNWAHAVPGYVISLSCMQTAGASFSWAKNNLCMWEADRAKEDGGNVYDKINAEIASVPAGSNGLIFLPHLLGERSPRWNPDTKGCFIGLKMENTHADMLRSVVEGIALNMRIILERMAENGADVSDLAIVGGLAKGEIERQIFASVWKHSLRTLNYLEEAGSIGAAIIAGVGIGEFESFDVVHRFVCDTGVVEPNEEESKVYDKYLPIFDRAYHALCPTFEELSKL